MPETFVKPNTGASVDDLVAVGNDTESQPDWMAKYKIDPATRVNVKKASHMRYQHPDMDKLHQFMLDFGMQLVKRTDEEAWYRGYGDDQYVYYAKKGPKKFLGGAFEAETQEDFDKAARLAEAGPVQELHNAPGGGSMVTITDLEGLHVHVIFGQQASDVQTVAHEKIIYNYPVEKHRMRKFNRYETGPAAVHKLGHFGYSSPRLSDQLDFYTRRFNLVPTDMIYVVKEGKRVEATAFMHIDRGEIGTDHHAFFLNRADTTHVHHCSFEVHDFDTQHLGHYWLAKAGYESVWGVGRHVLGSQIFDYWRDVHGNIIEHYADGDIVNKDTPVAYFEAASDSLSVWGPEVPKSFTE